MKLAIFSDLHLEDKVTYGKGFNLSFALDTQLNLEEMKHNVIAMVAGDVSSKPEQVIEFLHFLSKHYAQVIFTYGNHEYYRHDMQTMHLLIANGVAGLTNMHILHNAYVDIANYRFFGATLWTDFKAASPLDRLRVEQGLNDFYHIRAYPQASLIRVDDMISRHKQTMEALTEVIESMSASTVSAPQQLIVMTHHAPSNVGTLPQYGNDPLNHAFSANLDAFMASHTHLIPLWIHGHKHNDIDAMIADTRLVCHPMGYREEIKRVGGYKPKIIDLAGADR